MLGLDAGEDPGRPTDLCDSVQTTGAARGAPTEMGGSMTQDTIVTVLQLVVGLGLLNVWLVRSRSATAYRGGAATSLREEFAVYGLPVAVFYGVGVLKVSAGLLLVAGVWLDLPVRIAAGVVAALMVGALAMHVKVGDPVKKAIPATLMLVMSTAIALLAA